MNKIQYKKYVIFEVIKYKYKNMHICIILFNFSRQQGFEDDTVSLFKNG